MPNSELKCPSVRHLVEIAAAGAMQSVGKSRVFHRDFSKLLLKPASSQGFHRSGTLHSADPPTFSPTTNPEYPLLKEGRLAKRVGVVLKDAKLPLMPAKRSLIGALRDSLRTTPALRAFPSFKRRGDSNPHPPLEINGRHGTQPVFPVFSHSQFGQLCLLKEGWRDSAGVVLK